MKKIMLQIILVSALSVLMMGNVSANASMSTYYINKNGVAMNQLEFEKLSTIMASDQIEDLTQEEAEKYINGNIVATKTKYFKTIYQGDKVISETEISEKEFEEAQEKTLCTENTRGDDYAYFETSYKRFTASITELSNNHYFTATLQWKIVPVTRSYDVFAFRTKHLSYSTVLGVQTYYVGSYGTPIEYNSNSAGYKSASNGAGFSMNLKDDGNITSFLISICADMQISEYNYSTARVFVSYQHAQSSLTRTQSKSYTLQAGGLGDVIYYSDINIRNKYDGMSGIELEIPIP